MDFSQLINDKLGHMLSEIYTDLSIDSGNIFPEQALKWDSIVADLNALFISLVELNRDE